VEITASAEAIRPFMLLLDDFERQATGTTEVSLQAVVTQLRAAMERAGLERIGAPGDRESFDPTRHELLEAEEGQVSRVTIIRPGFRFRSQATGSVIRRALVKAE
jgi:molecular chaperone GrpE (heat shock protein)